MSFVADLVRRLDSQLEQLAASAPLSLSPTLCAPRELESSSTAYVERTPTVSESARTAELHRLLGLLPTASSSKTLLKPAKLEKILERARFSRPLSDEACANYEAELEWLLVSKVTVQTYGLVLNTFLKQTSLFNNDIWYWDEVLGSYSYTALYSAQTSPTRLWHWASGIYRDTRQRSSSCQNNAQDSGPETTTNETGQSFRPLTQRWAEFYGLVKDSVRDQSIADARRRVISPFAYSRAEARQKRDSLRKLREMSATGLGILVNECLSFNVDHEGDIITKGQQADASAALGQDEWKDVVEESIAVMEIVLRKVTSLDIGICDFEETVFSSIQNGSEFVGRRSAPGNTTFASSTVVLAKRLQQILQMHKPGYFSLSKPLATEYGRPSRIVRYWFPVAILLLSSTTIFRILVGRKAEITRWIGEVGETIAGFWDNWVVDPIRKVIGTIRHDEGSELALMSRRSLEGDRESLERMVVDYVIDRPRSAAEPPLSEVEIRDIKKKVREGDLTPILMAYERDLRAPLMGTIRGDLIRTLLVQVQKTKVDVEVAIGGIDALLKSQELVFGNIDRILTTSSPPSNGMLSYGEHGLLLCEVDQLRKLAKRIMPSDINREFVEEIGDLAGIRTGVRRQLRVVERIRWAFAQWLN